MPPFVFLFYRKIREILILFAFSCFRVFPIKTNRVVLCNVWGFGDNSKYVALELLKNKRNLELIYLTKRPKAKGLPKGICFLKVNSIAAIFALATAQVWVDCNRKEPYIRKRKKQYYIQTWHGSLALKKIEGDYANHLSGSYVKNAKKDSAMTNLYISNGAYCSAMYRRAFWYPGEILECGSPRLDAFVLPQKEEKRPNWKTSFGIATETKLAVFAPTYREHRGTAGFQGKKGMEDKNQSLHALDFLQLSKILKDKFGGKWKIILRLHPLVASSFRRKTTNLVVDASESEDLYEILKEADVLITDYSNTMFEFSLLKRPVFLYTPDRQEYEKDRGFYFPFSSLPFPKASLEAELYEKILDYEQEKEQKAMEQFFAGIDFQEPGTAARQVAKRIERIISEV